MGVSLAEQIERSIFRLLVVVLETRILESTFKTNDDRQSYILEE